MLDQNQLAGIKLYHIGPYLFKFKGLLKVYIKLRSRIASSEQLNGFFLTKMKTRELPMFQIFRKIGFCPSGKMPGFLDYYHPFFQDIEACMNMDCVLLHTAWMSSSVRLLFFLFCDNFFCQRNFIFDSFFSHAAIETVIWTLYVAMLSCSYNRSSCN